MNKGIATIWLIIAGVILIAGSAYWYWVGDIKPRYEANQARQSVQNFEKNTEKVKSQAHAIDTSNWKIYRNEKYGYQLTYPHNWFQKDITYDPTDDVALADNIIVFDSNLITKNREANHLPSRGLIIQTSISKSQKTNCPEGQLLQVDNITIAGIQHKRCKVEFGTIFYTVEIVKAGKIYNFSYPAETTETGTINQILSTFKFIEPQIDASTWKTYRNEKYGFEMKYPPNFTAASELFAEGYYRDKGYIVQLESEQGGPTIDVDKGALYAIKLIIRVLKNSNNATSPIDLTKVLGYVPEYLEYEGVEFNGIKFIRMKELGGMVSGNHFIIVHGNNIYEIEDSYGFYNNDGGRKLIADILSTFKFIK